MGSTGLTGWEETYEAKGWPGQKRTWEHRAHSKPLACGWLGLLSYCMRLTLPFFGGTTISRILSPP